MADSAPSISVVLPTVSTWPAIETTLDSLVEQVAAVDGEVIVLDGRGRALAGEPAPPVRWERVDLVDAFEIRAAGFGAARGGIIAIGEDHVVFDPDWCTQVLTALAERPDADGVVGGVANATDGVLDRASFWITLGPWADPIARLTPDRSPIPGNVVLRRSVCDGLADAPGRFEYTLLPTLLGEGRLAVNPGQRSSHDQSLGPRSTFGVHFASGRAWGAATERPGRWERLRTAARTPRVIVRQTHEFLAEREVRETRGFWCLVGALACMHAAGPVAGTLCGPGAARRRIV